MTVDLRHGDCLDVLRELADNSVDAIVTDPPYGLGFMGKAWDDLPPGLPWAQECLRVLKPGGHLLAFGGTRTWHRLACAIEDAGFEMRDSIAWLYGSGFSKGGLLGNKPNITWCACGENSVPLNHAGNSDLHSLRGDVHPTPIARGEGEDSGLLPPVQREVAGRGVGEARAQGSGSVEARKRNGAAGTHDGRVEPGMGGRLLHRAGQGLPDGPSAGSPASQGERLRGRAPVGDGKDDRTAGSTARGSASHQPRKDGQSTEEPEALREPRRALDDRALRGRAECPRCGGFDPAFRGFSVTLKPAFEPVVVARKPLVGTVAQNVLAYGTGAINVDAGRIDMGAEKAPTGSGGPNTGGSMAGGVMHGIGGNVTPPAGRWPANVALDSESAAALDQMSGIQRDGVAVQRNGGGQKIGGQGIYGGSEGMTRDDAGYGSGGGASRFFLTAEPDAPDLPIDELAERFMYCAKAPKSERPVVDGIAHNTVKPLALMRWLVRLVTPPGGTVLEPFAGSGTTVEAAILEGFNVIAIEREADYLPLIQARIFRAQAKVAAAAEPVEPPKKAKGRWPANVALDEESAEALDVQSGELKSPKTYERNVVGFNNETAYGHFDDQRKAMEGFGDSGGASKFFFVAKSEGPAPTESEVWRDGAQQPDLFADDDEESA